MGGAMGLRAPGARPAPPPRPPPRPDIRKPLLPPVPPYMKRGSCNADCITVYLVHIVEPKLGHHMTGATRPITLLSTPRTATAWCSTQPQVARTKKKKHENDRRKEPLWRMGYQKVSQNQVLENKTKIQRNFFR